MLYLRAHLRFHVREHKNMKKKIHFTLQLMIHMTVQSRGCLEGIFDGAPKDALSNLHKDAEEGACEMALKGVLELHLWLHLLMQ